MQNSLLEVQYPYHSPCYVWLFGIHATVNPNKMSNLSHMKREVNNKQIRLSILLSITVGCTTGPVCLHLPQLDMTVRYQFWCYLYGSHKSGKMEEKNYIMNNKRNPWSQSEVFFYSPICREYSTTRKTTLLCRCGRELERSVRSWKVNPCWGHSSPHFEFLTMIPSRKCNFFIRSYEISFVSYSKNKK